MKQNRIAELIDKCTTGLLRDKNIEPYVGSELVNITDLDNRVIDVTKLEAALLEYLSEVIGEDEKMGVSTIGKAVRNKFRAELREALGIKETQ